MKGKKYSPKIWNKNYVSESFWFCKPINGSQGKGVIITKNPEKIRNKFSMIIQENITSSLYQERKWDLRIYVLHRIINNKFETYLYFNGIIRLAPEKFKKNNLNKRSLVTNTSSYSKADDRNELNLCFDKHPNYKDFLYKIIVTIKDVHNTLIKQKFKRKKFKCQNHLFGYDFIFDQNHNPFILEVNTKPAGISKNNSQPIKDMKKKMYKNLYQKFIKSVFLEQTVENDGFIYCASDNINYF